MKLPNHASEPLEPDPVIEAYKKDVDRTLLRENLKLTYQERILKLDAMAAFREAFRPQPRKNSP